MIDVVIVNLLVHGGAYHKLIRLKDRLQEAGVRSKLLISCAKPFGLQMDVDVDTDCIEQLQKDDVFIVDEEELKAIIAQTPAKLYIFDFSEIDLIGELITCVREKHKAQTAQMGFFLDDFCYWGSDHVLLQHPLTLWFLLKHRRREDTKKLATAQSMHFVGNVMLEPILNTWTTTITSRDDLITKYNLDPSLPICLWLPDRADGFMDVYGEVVDEVQKSKMNLLVKLHPLEYKNIKHNLGKKFGALNTSAEKWNVTALEEKDSSWAMHMCDVAIVAASTVGIDISFWKKPVIYIEKKRTWPAEIVKACSTRIHSSDKLSQALATALQHPYDDAHYDTVREMLLP